MEAKDPDHNAVNAALNGNQGAYKLLYERHVDALFGFLMQFETERVQVSDWVQLSFIKAFQKLDQFMGKSSFKTWLYRIALNEMRQSKRKMRLHFESLEGLDEVNILEESFQLSDWITLKAIIKKLPERERLVLLMYEIEGFTHEEIALLLEINPNTSRSILYRTKQQLKNKLTK
jgi:RNA polymerase sigma-70 factor (ECF subfamily)